MWISTASGAIVSGSQNISAGGTTISSLVYGELHVSASGTAIGTSVGLGGSEYLSGGTDSGTVVWVSGRQLVSSGGIASDTTIQSGGVQKVFAGGLAVEPVQAAPGVGIQRKTGRGLGDQGVAQGQQHDVLEHVRVVAGVEGVAVVHAGIVASAWTSHSRRKPRHVLG